MCTHHRRFFGREEVVDELNIETENEERKRRGLRLDCDWKRIREIVRRKIRSGSKKRQREKKRRVKKQRKGQLLFGSWSINVRVGRRMGTVRRICWQ